MPGTPMTLVEALAAPTPPDDDQVISYGHTVCPGAVEIELAHNTKCPGWEDRGATFEVLETTGADLLTALEAADGRRGICGWCTGTVYGKTSLLHEAILVNKTVKTDFSWVDCAWAMVCEMTQPDHADEWTNWLCGKTVDQVRKEARLKLEWDKTPGEQYVAVFGAYGGTKEDWMLGAGEHVTKTMPYLGRPVVAYCLVPERIYTQNGGVVGAYAWGTGQAAMKRMAMGTAVRVEPGFTRQHLELAAETYVKSASKRGKVQIGKFNNSKWLAWAQNAVNTAVQQLP